jgi:hypothetical protein
MPERTIANPEYASSFADWVFRQRHPLAAERQSNVQQTLAHKERGKIDHKIVLESICRSADFRATTRRATTPNEWRVVHADLDQDSRTFLASNLSVAGRPMRCRPDLVLQHRFRKTLIVVEYKFTGLTTANRRLRNGTRRCFAPNGYENNRAQLWCYSQIDEFRHEQPLLVLQFRDPNSLEHKATMTWPSQHRDIREAAQWFEQYRRIVALGEL